MFQEHNFAIVKDVMSIPIIYIKTNETAQDAIERLQSKGIHKAVISDPQEKMIGYTDIWKLGLLERSMSIGDALQNKRLIYSEISTVNQNRPLKEIMPELLKKGMLVVTDDKGDKVGVITPQDIRKVRQMDLRI